MDTIATNRFLNAKRLAIAFGTTEKNVLLFDGLIGGIFHELLRCMEWMVGSPTMSIGSNGLVSVDMIFIIDLSEAGQEIGWPEDADNYRMKYQLKNMRQAYFIIGILMLAITPTTHASNITQSNDEDKETVTSDSIVNSNTKDDDFTEQYRFFFDYLAAIAKQIIPNHPDTDMMLGNGDFLLNFIPQRNDLEVPFKTDDVTIIKEESQKGYPIYIWSFPDPKTPPLCKYVAFALMDDRCEYFTAEKSVLVPWMICTRISPNGKYRKEVKDYDYTMKEFAKDVKQLLKKE